MNVLRELSNFFRMQAGIVFVSQFDEPKLPLGVASLWHNAITDRLRFRGVSGATMEIEPPTLIEHRFVLSAGPTAKLDFALGERQEIVDVIAHKAGSAGGGEGSVQLVNAQTNAAITEALSINVEPGQLIRPIFIHSQANLVEEASALRFLRTRGASTDESVVVYVTARRP